MPDTIGGALWLVSQRAPALLERGIDATMTGDAAATLATYEPSDRDREILAEIRARCGEVKRD